MVTSFLRRSPLLTALAATPEPAARRDGAAQCAAGALLRKNERVVRALLCAALPRMSQWLHVINGTGEC
jgi:hypothetical protein